MFRKAEIAIPPWNQNHIILEILPLNLGLLEDYDIRLEDIEHGLYSIVSFMYHCAPGAVVPYVEASLLSPWLVSERVPYSCQRPT